MTYESFTATLALIGIVVIVASLLSGAVERTGLPQVAIFLLLGAALGPAGLGLVELTLDSSSLQVIATLALVLVLFSDAVGVDIGEVRQQRRLGLLILGPGTLLPAALIAVGAWWLLGLSSHAVGLFLLGPMFGVFAGWLAITLLDQVRRRVGVRRDYESLYALGVAFTAFAAAEAVGGSGFLAAFAAGLMIAALDVELCDCFLDYGQATAEMFLLLTFVAFGTGLIWTGLPLAADWRTLLFAALALVVRTVVLLPVLRRSGIDKQSRRLIAMFGPRGLSSMLLVLLPVFAGVPGSEHLFAVTCLVVLLSVVVHGGGIALYLRREDRSGATAAVTPTAPAGPAPAAPVPVSPAAASSPTRRAPEPAPSLPAGGDGRAPEPGDAVPEKITIAEFQALQRAGEPVVLADVRTERSYREDPDIAVGAIRLPPDDAVRLARERRLDQHATLVLYCA